MKEKLFKFILVYFKILIDWLWKKIKSLWDLILHFPPNILTIINLLILIFALHLSIQNTRETQKRWEEEISQKPDLYLVADSIAMLGRDTLFVHFQIENRGNMTAKNCHMNLFIPVEYQFIGEKWQLSLQEQDLKQYYYGVIEIVAYSSTPGRYPFVTNQYLQFKLKKLSNVSFPKKLKYVIYEDKIGTQNGELKLDIPR